MKLRLTLATVSLAGCVATGDDDATTTRAAAVTGPPALVMQDTFVAFQPGLFGYAIDRGSTSGAVAYTIGSTILSVTPSHDIAPHDDAPDMKKRVRLTLSDTDPNQNPSGDITVTGKAWERNWANPENFGPTSQIVEETIHFAGPGTKTTSVYFDEIDEISTPGLGMNANLTVEWWDGHEQEMSVGVVLSNITDQATCEDGYRVYFNGQLAYPDWDPIAAKCSASLLAGATAEGGITYFDGAYRGMYFGLDVDDDASDAFHHFVNPTKDPHVPSGHWSPGSTWADWYADLSSGASLFVPLPETHIRPIVVQLERQSDLHVTDAARMLLRIGTDPWGNPGLVAKLGTIENPGAIAQLSPRGLDRLEPTHKSTLPYPIVPAGTQPRLSARAIALPEHTTTAVEVDLAALPSEDLAYWTEPNPDTNGQEFAGYLAYQDIKSAASVIKLEFDFAMKGCNATPNPVLCQNALRATYCVESKPRPEDFRIRIDGVDTYFDPARPDDALAIGDVTNMDLSFGTNEILSDYTLADVKGWLMASIDPANIYIEWDKGPLDPCVRKPAARPLSDFLTDSDDYGDWLTCRDLSFAAGSGTLGDPLAFQLTPSGEQLQTSFAPGTPNVSLASITPDAGAGICGDDWLVGTIETAIEDWQPDVEGAIAAELATSPGQDEALDRLLSPYELGIESVTAPPPGTPPYDVHPLATYDLLATIAKTTSDTRFPGADATDGMYVPYLTRSLATGSTPYLWWFCPAGGGQDCTGLADEHPTLLEAGLDPAGDLFDVSITYTTAHLNQALWAQARRSDRLGSPTAKAHTDISTTAIVDLATASGYTDLTAALAPYGTSFGIRFYQEGAPYTSVGDNIGVLGPFLVYVIPNIVVELVSIASDGSETVIAKVLVDVVDRDHQLSFSTGGAAALTSNWGALQILSMTSTFLPGCDGALNATSCNSHLLSVLGALWWPRVEGDLRDMIAQAPGLHLFDVGQEAPNIRHLENVRTFKANQSVILVGDLCKPGSASCP